MKKKKSKCIITKISCFKIFVTTVTTFNKAKQKNDNSFETRTCERRREKKRRNFFLTGFINLYMLN